METAYLFLSKVINKLSDQLVADYMSSSELGPNFHKIKEELMHTQALLYEAQQRDLSDNPGLQGLVEMLNNKADEAEDALDELHYFKIQDELDGTQYATPDLGGGLRNQAQHVGHVVRHNTGNWFPCFTCCRSQHDVTTAATHTTDKGKHQTGAIVSHGDKGQLDRVATSDSGSDEHAQKLQFDRVAMSNKIKQLIEEIRSLCDTITKQLQISISSNPQRVIGDTLKRPITSSTITQNELYGRDVIYEKTIADLTGGQETLSALPIVGPGGIGKTTFTQHLYHDGRIQKAFPVRIWVCVSNNFDILRLTQEILCCIPAAEKEDASKAFSRPNLSKLQEDIEERLKSKRFLLVLDDMWECNKTDRDNLLGPLGKGETKGNMVLITTRKESVAEMMKSKQIDPIKLRGLEPDEFWKFFQDCAFGGEVKDEDKHDLIDIAKAISDKLKGSPLAAKTVGPLLQKNFSQDHWIGILNNKQWENLKDPADIMPALKISYDYLPSFLKKCFSYCALFPEDHKFYIVELRRFWDAMGIMDAGGETYRAEDLVDELVGNGFLIRQEDGSYMLHDLLHELSQSVSSQECVNISFNGFVADKIPPYVRHISITIQNKCAKNIDSEMNKLKTRIDIGNLRTLMIFASNISHKHHTSKYYVSRKNANILKHTFDNVRDLRVLFIFMLSLECLPCNFSKLIHLRYLKFQNFSSVSLPSAISRFYHLKYFILENTDNYNNILENTDNNNNVPKDFNNLVNLRHIQASNEFQSSIPEVGKMKCLEVLNEFCVKKKDFGFELEELGKLANLGGQLSIRGLEKVKNKEEAEEALLKNKCNLNRLTLEFSTTEQTTGHDAIEGLQPPPDLKELVIECHRGATGPSWLCRPADICVTKLECLCLVKISWDTLPPFGRLPLLRSLELRKICGLRQFRLDSYGVSDGSFKHFKTIELYDMPDLVEWIGGANSHLFSKIENIVLSGCPNLTTLPFSDGNDHPIEVTHIKWFPCLRKLKICRCPKLSHLPPVPYTSTLTSVEVSDHWHQTLRYRRDNELVVWGYYGALDFGNLGKIEYTSISDAPQILLTDLQMLSSLRQLNLEGDMFSGEVGDGVVIPSVQKFTLERFHPSGMLLSNVFKCLPALSELTMGHSNEDPEELILQFPPSNLLHKIYMYHCKNMILSAECGGAFRDLTSLQSLTILSCGKIFSQWISAEAIEVINTLPPSIRELTLWSSFSDNLSTSLLSNLTSITHLSLLDVNLTTQGFNPLSLKSLEIRECVSSVAGDLLALPVPAASWQLESLCVDVAAVLVDPICSRLSPTLRRLSFYRAGTIEGFTEEQEKALQLLNALEELEFISCRVLQSLPETIDRFYSLKKLRISECPRTQCLPKCGLPTSLEFLGGFGCSDELRMELQDLIETSPDFEIVFD